MYLSTDITASIDEDNRISGFIGPKVDFSFPNSDEILSKVVTALSANPQLNGYLVRALADYNQTIQVPHDTGFYCYRSIEALSQAFHSTASSTKEKWVIFRESLNIEENFIKWLTSYAEPQRHGHLPFISWEDRRKAIKTAQTVIVRFLDYMNEK